MKKNAFTLAELLAIIAILGIIAIVTAPNITNLLNDSKHNVNETQIVAIEQAARNYGVKHIFLVNGAPSETIISLQTLVDSGYLDNKRVKNLVNNQDVMTNGKVCVTWEEDKNQFKYTYKETGAC